MSLTPEEKERRAQRSRRNGAKSRGARSLETRRRSCLNALKAGLRAKTYLLPHETEAAAARSRQWHDWYQPESPAAIHLTDEDETDRDSGGEDKAGAPQPQPLSPWERDCASPQPACGHFAGPGACSRAGPHPACGHPLPGGEGRGCANEPGNALEGPAQVGETRDVSANEGGAEDRGPSGVPRVIPPDRAPPPHPLRE
jgi:hypothetical protein